MGYCLYGNDIDDDTTPLEAGLGWITKFTKEFTAKDILEKQKSAGINKKLVGIQMVDKGIPRHGYVIKNTVGEVIGVITSGTQSPTLGKPIAMGYVRVPFNQIDTEVYVKIREKLLIAKVVKIPFA
jgi:aminomethyltransferase